jgi:predicted nucleotidyltransferase
MAIRRLKKLSDKEITALQEALKSLVHTHDEIVFALLYGSIISPEIPGMVGDVDLAIYVQPSALRSPKHVLESELEAEAHQLLSTQGSNFPPVEVVVINEAPYSFAAKLLKTGYLVLKEDEETLTDFIERVGEKSMDNSYLRQESLNEVLEG